MKNEIFSKLCCDIATARLVEEYSDIPYAEMLEVSEDGTEVLMKDFQEVFDNFYDKAEEYYSKFIRVEYD